MNNILHRILSRMYENKLHGATITQLSTDNTSNVHHVTIMVGILLMVWPLLTIIIVANIRANHRGERWVRYWIPTYNIAWWPTQWFEGRSHQTNKSRPWPSPTTYYWGGNEALLVGILIPIFFPFLISAISISHNNFLNISEILFFSGFYWYPP